MRDTDRRVEYAFAYEVMTNINMLGAGVELVVVSVGDGGLIVAMDSRGNVHGEPEIGEEAAQPNGLLGRVRKRKVLGLQPP